MKAIMSIFFFVFCQLAICDSRKRAMSHARRAFLKTPSVRRIKKRYEKKLRNLVPEKYENRIVTGAAVLYSASRGEVSTRSFKNIRIKIKNGKIRPDIRYNIRDNKINAEVRMDWRF